LRSQDSRLHEENDTMHPIAFGVTPLTPTIGTAAEAGSNVTVSFTDNSSVRPAQA
jgi:hypothetical protein